MPTDSQLLLIEAERGLEDLYYLSRNILEVGRDELGMAEREQELRPIYNWFDQPRPSRLTKKDKWFRFWSAPRFTAKTYVVLVYVLARIIRNPNITVGLQSQEKNFSTENGNLLRDWLERPELTRLYGDFRSNRWDTEKGLVASQRTRTQRDPTVRTIGLDNPLQGKRVDLMVFDDMTGGNNNNPEGLKKVESRYDESLPLVKPGGEIIWICTRWNPFDMSSSGNTINDRPGIIQRFDIAKREGVPDKWDCAGPRGFFGCYAVEGDEEFFPYAVVGEPLFPATLPESTIQEFRDEMLHGVFASQILNEPIAEEMRLFSSDDFQYFDAFVDGELNPMLAGAVPFLAVDPASARRTKTPSADDSTFCVAYIKWTGDTFDVFVVEWMGGRWRSDRVQNQVLNLYEQWRPRMIYPEVNTGGAYFLDPIRKAAREKGYFLPIHEVTASLHGTGKKAERITGIASYYRQRRIWHDRRFKSSKGETQLLQHTGDENNGHDDFADVLAHLIHEATKQKWAAKGKAAARKKRRGIERRYKGV